MSLYMPDTNIVSDLLRNPDLSAARHIADVGPDTICVSIITAADLRYGCARTGSAKLSAHVEAILERVQVLACGAPADAEYGGMRVVLEATGRPIGPNDLLIAAHARAAGAILVTDSTGNFPASAACGSKTGSDSR